MTTLAMAKTAPKQLHNDLVQGRTCPAGAARGLESAAAILFLQLIFPDKVPPIAKRLAWMGALSVGAQAAGALVAEKKREEFVQRLRQRGGSMLDKLGHTKSAPMRGGTGPARAAAVLAAHRMLHAKILMLHAKILMLLCPKSTCRECA